MFIITSRLTVGSFIVPSFYPYERERLLSASRKNLVKILCILCYSSEGQLRSPIL